MNAFEKGPCQDLQLREPVFCNTLGQRHSPSLFNQRVGIWFDHFLSHRSSYRTVGPPATRLDGQPPDADNATLSVRTLFGTPTSWTSRFTTRSQLFHANHRHSASEDKLMKAIAFASLALTTLAVGAAGRHSSDKAAIGAVTPSWTSDRHRRGKTEPITQYRGKFVVLRWTESPVAHSCKSTTTPEICNRFKRRPKKWALHVAVDRTPLGLETWATSPPPKRTACENAGK